LKLIAETNTEEYLGFVCIKEYSGRRSNLCENAQGRHLAKERGRDRTEVRDKA
jgi:hypothetical protein